MADKQAASSIVASLVVVLVGALVAWAGSQGGVTVGSMPVFALIVCYAFVVQWLAFVPSYLRQTERYYDLTGSFTYISAIVLAVVLSGATDARSILLLVLVLVWAGRLGPFLFRRVRRAGKDDRFDEIKRSFSRLLMTWTLQGLWVSLTLAAALAAVTSTEPKGLDVFAFVGLAVWVDRLRARSHRRPAEEPFPRGPCQQGLVHHLGPVGDLPAPELLRRDHAVGRHRDHRPAGAPGLAVRDSHLAGLRLPAHHPRERRAAPREEGRRDVGRPGGVRGVQAADTGPGPLPRT